MSAATTAPGLGPVETEACSTSAVTVELSDGSGDGLSVSGAADSWTLGPVEGFGAASPVSSAGTMAAAGGSTVIKPEPALGTPARPEAGWGATGHPVAPAVACWSTTMAAGAGIGAGAAGTGGGCLTDGTGTT